MNDSRDLLKHLGIGFVLALAIYVVSYTLIEHRRYEKGPWEVSFESVSNGVPAMVISQPHMHLNNVRIVFPGEMPPATNAPASMKFEQPKEWPFAVPFGKVVFEDLTFWPGTVSFDVYGHEVELIPRVLIVDRAEVAWRSGETITLYTTNKPPPRVEKKKRY